MLKRPVIESKYVDKTREIVYCGSRDDMTEEQASAFLSKGHDKLKNANLENDNLDDYVINNGPLFAIQNEKPTCSRTRMGSDWNCRLCVKYFGTTCKAW
ncbi:hypothetical protein Desdi_1623 [Desulfitobacterium dichloroeliminans LMG P-21439]|uniref:Uncharacterized protein n=1 Tax=Desulfitobacterium dichloroeliminans (strain LMG P-21439 / DCA1) TaxID=871963 RepID=L0F5M2_DESDL|nr:hypothetical protein [Desulfitobacterium dichloroeliminans]AGA69114.1 hypothetical protein Desdi_1623 [Desulfitobacterium dichloroeliminans LMG P-21439]